MKAIKHNCGDGYKGFIVRTKGIAFCGFCGREFKSTGDKVEA